MNNRRSARTGAAVAAVLAGAVILAAGAEAVPYAHDWGSGDIPVLHAAKAMQEDEPEGMTFYCCDASGEVRCTVNAPGPSGKPCFCPGVEPAGILCAPPQPPPPIGTTGQ